MAVMDAEAMQPWRTSAHRSPRGRAMDRLQPALLDRLMDNDPSKRNEPREGAQITHPELRAAVLRDLGWLLNTVNLETTDEISHYRWVRGSALNFGVRAMAGKRMSEIDWVDLEDSIREAIVHFEPRILPSSIEVSCVTDTGTLEHHNIVSLSIRGKLWCVPFPLEFLFRSDIDLESGHIDLRDMGNS